jgi:DNA-binding LytR/AlgR family response regulator
MNIKTIIIDDEPLAISLLESYVAKNESLELLQSFTNPIDAIEFIQNNEVDLVFLDIQMPELSGVNLMKIVGDKVKYILTTAYSEYALEGFEHNVIDYLLKPISISRFEKSIEKAKERLPKQQVIEETSFFVKSSGQRHRIVFDEVLYVESIKDYVNIKTLNNEFIVLDTLKSMESQLPESQFSRIHKSYIVNRNLIQTIDVKSLILNNGSEIPIGESYKMNFLKQL